LSQYSAWTARGVGGPLITPAADKDPGDTRRRGLLIQVLNPVRNKCYEAALGFGGQENVQDATPASGIGQIWDGQDIT